MADATEMRRMPRGERCVECGSQRWYVEDGLRFCGRGHQIEGFVQFSMGDAQDAGLMGSVARREKEVRQSEQRQLTGGAGKALYLEALQLILRHQIQFLVRQKGHPEGLETTCRALWAIRIRGAPLRAAEDIGAEGELEMFSSQPNSEDDHPTTSHRNRARAQSWDPDCGQNWPMPNLAELAALCYLGCVLQRLPTRLGTMCKWIRNGHMPFSRAFHILPQEIQDRMPSQYVRALKLPLRSNLNGDYLHLTVIGLVLSYGRNWGLEFPELNRHLILHDMALELRFPIESMAVFRILCDILEMKFDFPKVGQRVRAHHFPEVRLVALLLVSTKMCFPFDISDQPMHLVTGKIRYRFDWDKWREGLPNPSASPTRKDDHDFSSVTPSQIIDMDDSELDAFLTRASGSVDTERPDEIGAFFPRVVAPSTPPAPADTTEHDIEEDARNTFTMAYKPGQQRWSEVGVRDIARYDGFRRAEDLSEIARAVYAVAGVAAGVSIETMTKAVWALEQRVMAWQKTAEAQELTSAA